MLVYDIEYSYTEYPFGDIIHKTDIYKNVYIVEVKSYFPRKQCCTLHEVKKRYVAIDLDGTEIDIELESIKILKAYDNITLEDYTEFYKTHPITIRESR